MTISNENYVLIAYDARNSENTIDYLRYLLAQFPNQRLLIFWHGASYHRSTEIRCFLEEVNQGLKVYQLINGKYIAFALPLIAQNKIQLRIFGYKLKPGFDVSVP